MKISVAICTWNRCELLRQTLQHLRSMQVPDNVDWELIVVDNRSTDATREVILGFENELPIVYEFEPQPGHSVSRNRAIQAATGELIVWTDNDVLVDPGWLTAYAAGAATYRQAAFFGGKIVPLFASEKPAWLAQAWKKCRPVYAARDLGNEAFVLAPNQFPYGANFAVRAEIQKQFLFDAQHGRQGGKMLGEDEIAVLQRIVQAGHQGVWLPQAVVQHFIPDDRATPEYVAQYFEGQGIANVLKQKTMTRSKWDACWTAWHHWLCYRWKRNRKPPEQWVSHMIRASIAWGEYRADRSSHVDD